MKEVNKSRLDELATELEIHAENGARSFINCGRLLCQARKEFPADKEFGGWRNNRLPWMHRNTATAWMNAYRNGGEKLVHNNCAPAAIYQLTAPSVPEAAREEAIDKAQAGETITVKMAKQMVKEAKESVLKKDIEKLQPVLARLATEGVLPVELAEEFSLLPLEAQTEIAKVYLDRRDEIKQAEQSRQNLQAERRKLADANERAMKAISEKDEFEVKVDELAEKGAQVVIAEKDREIKRKETELNQLRVDMREEIEQDMGTRIRREVVREKAHEVKRANDAVDEAKRKAIVQEDRIKHFVDENMIERARAEKAEAELESAMPIEKDAQHARQLSFILSDLKSSLEKISGDCEPHQRIKSEKIVRELIEEASGFLGSSQEIIDI